MKPIGRQSASGLSFCCTAMRFFFRSAAHGVNGNPSGKAVPISPNVATGGVPGGGGGGGAPRPPGFGNLTQLPARSGLPSAVRGAGASRLTAPSAVRGTPLVGYFGHCADSDDDNAMVMATTVTV
jgi:hypothetical protein